MNEHGLKQLFIFKRGCSILNTYEKLSQERKVMQANGTMPAWYSTAGWQLFKEKYLYKADNPKQQYQRIAKTLAAHTPDPDSWYHKFFNLLWKGWLSPSTPVLANTGTNRGLPVSCAGTYVGDSIFDIYYNKLEVAMLTKHGFGTASYLGDVRPRGDEISVGGNSEGLMPIIKRMIDDMEYVSQGSARRGSWAGYVPIDHGDFDEVADYLKHHPDGNNIGWNISNPFIEALNNKDPEANRRYAKAMVTKLPTGKGYFWFNDKANAKRPQWYVDQELFVRSSQLCSEISLFSDKDHTFTCVLSSMNAVYYDDWKDTDAVFEATVFLDCVAQEFIERGKNIKGLEKAIRFTKKSRALGLGVCGYHSKLQKDMIPFESLEAHAFNVRLFDLLNEESKRASKWIAEVWGEPEIMKGYGYANTHRLAVAPTKSTALLMGGISEGINPDTAFVFTQRTPAGEIDRVNPFLLKIMKDRGVYDKKHIEEIRDAMGSVQGVDWLTEHEKKVFKTAFEINQKVIIREGATRGKFIDQWQSLNLFFAAGEDEEYINETHKEAFLNEYILGLYYIYSKASVQASKDECTACQ